MSSTPPSHRLAASALALTLALGLGACSSDGSDTKTTADSPVLSFEPVPDEATRLGVCTAITIDQIQGLLGPDTVASLPSSITEGGGEVTGEGCTWEAKSGGEARRSIRVEARDFGAGLEALNQRFEDLRAGTAGATDLPGVGDAAFSATTDDATVVHIRSGQYLLTASSRGVGGEAPVGTAELGMILAATLGQLP